jgi:hypothetical protein
MRALLGINEDRSFAKRLCDELNRSNLDIQGRVESLSLASLKGLRVQNLCAFPLCGERHPNGSIRRA